MTLKTQALTVVGLWASLLLFLVLTAPPELPAVFFVVPFLLLYAGLSRLWRMVVRLRLGEEAAEAEGLPERRLRAGNAVSALLVLLLVLQSLGQLTWRDVLTLALIFAVGYFYLVRMRREAPR